MSVPSSDEYPQLPQKTRAEVLRDLLVFQAKLFVDGVKDLLLSPVTLVVGLIGIIFSGKPGDSFYRVLRFGKLTEHWIDLFGAAYPTGSTDNAAATQSATQDFDTLVDRLQSSLLDPEQRARLSEKSKSQLDAIAKKLRRSDPPQN